MMFGPYPRYSAAQAAGLMLVVAVLAVPAYMNLGQYSNFYDGGVYLESARMMSYGFAPYREVFAAQPPLWLELIRCSFALFGQSMLAAQLLTVSALVATAIAIGFIALRTGGWLSAVLALVIILLSPLVCFWSREITAELPSTAFATLGLALATQYASDGKRVWLVAEALSIACALQVKLFGVYVLPAVVLIAAGRWKSVVPFSQRLWHMAVDAMLTVLIVSVTVVLVTLAYGPSEVWNQAVAFHLVPRSHFGSHGNWSLIMASLGQEPSLSCVLLLAACAALEPWAGWAALVWLATTLVGLLIQHPLFTHHLVSLIPPIALAAGIGLGALLKLGARLRAADARLRLGRGCARAAGAGIYVACVMLFVAVSSAAIIRGARQPKLEIHHPPSADLAVASELMRLTQKSDVILTDAPGIAFQVDRAVPPWLADTSRKRILNHYLTTAEVISQVERYHVKTVLLWTGRLEHLPGLVPWLEQNFPSQRKYSAERTLYVRP